MAQVYILSEDDFDDQVYVYVLETLLKARVDLIPFRLRRGGGIGEVRRKLPLLLAAIRRAGPVDDTYFVVSIDNDRAPEHSTHEPHAPRAHGCRRCELDDAIHVAMPDGWPIPGAVAVPVQMIEAWLLLMYEPARATCGRRRCRGAGGGTNRLRGASTAPSPRRSSRISSRWSSVPRAAPQGPTSRWLVSCVSIRPASRSALQASPISAARCRVGWLRHTIVAAKTALAGVELAILGDDRWPRRIPLGWSAGKRRPSWLRRTPRCSPSRTELPDAASRRSGRSRPVALPIARPPARPPPAGPRVRGHLHA